LEKKTEMLLKLCKKFKDGLIDLDEADENQLVDQSRNVLASQLSASPDTHEKETKTKKWPEEMSENL
jgi:hypothetical protein